MKIQTDFVSNSSSSSFICAVNSAYELGKLVEDIASGCSNPECQQHNDSLEEANRVTVSYCLENYRLLFLGRLKVGEREFRRSKAEQLERNRAKFGKELDEAALLEKTEADWKELVHQAKWENEVADFNKRPATYDEKAEIVTFYDEETVGGLAVSKSQAWHMSCRRQECESAKEVVRYAKWWHENQDDVDFIDTYSVDADTLRTTRLLIAAGIQLEMDDWEKDLDGLEKRLAAGERLFAVRIAYEGDGKDATALYKEDGASGIEDLAVEVLHSEAL